MKVYVIGAGLAGLSASVYLTQAGFEVILFESAGHAGGRCRSFEDQHLELEIDNGNHLILGANKDIFSYLSLLGVDIDHAFRILPAEFHIVDLQNQFVDGINTGNARIPWWIFNKNQRLRNTSWVDYLDLLKLFFARKTSAVTDVINTRKPVFKKLIEPLTLAIMNTPANQASAKVLATALGRIFGYKNGFLPFVSQQGLSKIFVQPALQLLRSNKVSIFFNHILKELIIDQEKPKLIFANRVIDLDPRDRVVLAVPPNIVQKLNFPTIYPNEYESILNGHYKVDLNLFPKINADIPKMIGVIGGLSDWLFIKQGMISTTKSAANNVDVTDYANKNWVNVQQTVQLLYGITLPEFLKSRIIVEKRATFLQNPHNCFNNRPEAKTHVPNFYLAGDWTNTGLPVTIEGAILSGKSVAKLIAQECIGQ
jgi:squalene-associated FAD-dependent desaturase